MIEVNSFEDLFNFDDYKENEIVMINNQYYKITNLTIEMILEGCTKYCDLEKECMINCPLNRSLLFKRISEIEILMMGDKNDYTNI